MSRKLGAIHPAFYLGAQYKMGEEGDDAFFDAIDNLKAGTQAEYEPAKKLLEELVPPGTDFYRELPEPTNDEIMSAIGRGYCYAFMGNRMCVNFTGVRSKSCFQTNATDFSCELVLGLRCDLGSNPLMRLFENQCPSVSDPQFKTIRKRNDGKWVEG